METLHQSRVELSKDDAEFASELLKVVRSFRGVRSVNHAKAAKCNFGPTTERCMSVGMSAQGVDCSGLMNLAFCELLGRKVDEWPRNLRHVRDYYPAVPHERFSLDALQPGLLVIEHGRYSIDGVDSLVPKHIGVVERGNYMLHTATTKVVRAIIATSPDTSRFSLLNPADIAQLVIKQN